MKSATGKYRSRSFRNGTSTVEFALGLPIMLLLLFGAIEFARANQVVNAAAFSAYQGCRMAIIPGGNAAAATAATRQVLDAMSIGNATISVTPSPILDNTAAVTVLVSIQTDDVGWIAPMFTGGENDYAWLYIDARDDRLNFRRVSRCSRHPSTCTDKCSIVGPDFIRSRLHTKLMLPPVDSFPSSASRIAIRLK